MNDVAAASQASQSMRNVGSCSGASAGLAIRDRMGFGRGIGRDAAQASKGRPT